VGKGKALLAKPTQLAIWLALGMQIMGLTLLLVGRPRRLPSACRWQRTTGLRQPNLQKRWAGRRGLWRDRGLSTRHGAAVALHGGILFPLRSPVLAGP